MIHIIVISVLYCCVADPSPEGCTAWRREREWECKMKVGLLYLDIHRQWISCGKINWWDWRQWCSKQRLRNCLQMLPRRRIYPTIGWAVLQWCMNPVIGHFKSEQLSVYSCQHKLISPLLHVFTVGQFFQGYREHHWQASRRIVESIKVCITLLSRWKYNVKTDRLTRFDFLWTVWWGFLCWSNLLNIRSRAVNETYHVETEMRRRPRGNTETLEWRDWDETETLEWRYQDQDRDISATSPRWDVQNDVSRHLVETFEPWHIQFRL